MKIKAINLILIIAIIGIGVFLIFLLKNARVSPVVDANNLMILNDNNESKQINLDQQPRDEISVALNKALNFLIRDQSPGGGFSACTDSDKQDCQNEHQPPIIAAQVLIVLNDIPAGEEINHLKRKAIQFLLSLQGEGGLWKYYDYLPPDLDDTSLASLALKLNDQNFISNIDQFISSRNKEGVFETWDLGQNTDSQNNTVKQDVDCVINANILAYLVKADLNTKDIISPICDYFRANIANEQSCSLYYPSRLMFFYSLSRALNFGVSCISESKEAIIQETLKKFDQKDGGFGDEMETAFAVNTLLGLGYKGDEADKAIQYLLQKQNKDGSFNSGVVFTNGSKDIFYSPALSTAIAVEALARYQRAFK